MKTLDDIRNEINALDRDLRRLFIDRLALSREVSEIKKTTGSDTIYRPGRENEILSNITQGLSGEASLKLESLYRSILRLSRETQYSLLLDTSEAFSPGFTVEEPKRPDADNPPVVCYQGLPGAYSHAAAGKMHPGSLYRNVCAFEDIFLEVSEGKAACGVLPLENSTAGIVSEVYDLLMKYRLFINRSFMLPINHALLAHPDATLSGIRRVLSHPQALCQCGAFLRELRCETVPVLNTAVAAKTVSELKSPDAAAIASEDVAATYGLCVLKRDIANEKVNYTRFISISPSLVRNPNDDKIVAAFNLPHRSGSLAEALSIFADYRINLSHIQSRPRPDTPFEYSFYVDFDGNLADRGTRAVLLQLERELPMLRILGTYETSCPQPA